MVSGKPENSDALGLPLLSLSISHVRLKCHILAHEKTLTHMNALEQMSDH
jgi:hypothetical protein